MPLYEFTRRQLPDPQQTPLRWSLWWKAAVRAASGLYIEVAISHLLSDPWVIDGETGDKALSFFRKQPGWLGDDGHGTPITIKRLSPLEEHRAIIESGFTGEERAKREAHLACPMSAPRTVKRSAERAFHKLVEMQTRKAATLEKTVTPCPLCEGARHYETVGGELADCQDCRGAQ